MLEMLMILSPAKTFKTIELEPFNLSENLIFADKTKVLVEQLQQHSKQELASLMKMSEALAEINETRFKNFYRQKSKLCMPFMRLKERPIRD